MPDQQLESHEAEENEHRTRGNGIISTVTEQSPEGSISMLLGGALLVRALGSRRTGRSLLYAFGGAGLVAFGVRKRRSRADKSAQKSGRLDTSDTGTSEQRSDSHQIDINPRGTGDGPDVETETEPDEGPIQFTEDRPEEPRGVPDLDEPASEDPRLDDDDEVTEIDLSDSAMADEASEAAGPAPEQAQPTQTEGTEPEPTPEADSSHVDVDDETEDTTDDTGDTTDEAGDRADDAEDNDDVTPDDNRSDDDVGSNNDETSKSGETTDGADSEGDETDTT